jgi:hypothetical protein
MRYHQIETDPSGVDETEFSTKQGHWAYRKMPFGLPTAPAVFMRLMNTVLSGLAGTRYCVFLDEIMIFVYVISSAEHDAKLRTVLERLRKYSLSSSRTNVNF